MTEEHVMEGYIHIPFCAKKCSYCDFLSFPAGRKLQHSYADALIREIRECARNDEAYTMSTVFLGGGTPSLLEKGEISRIMSALRESYRISGDAEITIEANPRTVDEYKLEEYLKAGINRISIGCQSLDDGQLRKLGRLHDSKSFFDILSMAQSAGFKNISVDLMSGLPDQSCEQWRDTLVRIAESGVRHISAYSLIIEEGTPFFEMENELRLPDEDETLEMYEITGRLLDGYGFKRYEVSNYALKGFESRHNTGYWTGVLYRGFGLGSSSYMMTDLQGEKDSFFRYRNTADINDYICNSSSPDKLRQDIHELKPEELYSEFMILGLRLTEGISVKEFNKRFGRDIFEVFGDVLNKHIRQGTLLFENSRIRIPEKYFFVSNGILSDFI